MHAVANTKRPKTVAFVANSDWYLLNFRGTFASDLVAQGHVVYFVAPTGPYTAEIKRRGVKFVNWPVSRAGRLNAFEHGRSVLALCKVYRRIRPDITHHFTLKAVLFGSIAAALTGSSKIINSITGLGHTFIDSGIRAACGRLVVRTLIRATLSIRSTELILQNRDDLAEFSWASHWNKTRTWLIRGSGVDIERFSPVTERRPETQRPVSVLFVGRLIREKGLVEFLEAARLLADDRSIEFTVVGAPDPGNPSNITAKERNEWPTRYPNVTFLGGISDLHPIYGAADMVVLPSYREGLPRTLLEAGAMGKPVVTTGVPGCRELVQDGVNGLIVPVRDALSLSRAIQKLASSPALRAQLGSAGRQIVVKSFSDQVINKMMLRVYGDGFAEPLGDAFTRNQAS